MNARIKTRSFNFTARFGRDSCGAISKASGRCIDASRRCDGHSDCHDGSDEKCEHESRDILAVEQEELADLVKHTQANDLLYVPYDTICSSI